MKKVLVTGANRGIGKEICQQLLSLGHFVIACGRDLGKLKNAFPQETNNIFLQVLYVNNEESVAEAAKKLQVKFSKIDFLINNAGIGVGNSDLDDVDIEEVKQIFETNFLGPMRVNKYFLPMLKRQ
jgi:NAD(P)-dependent dehydrogenase (short-subunit alcohol dehydrogenase family)